jgi:dihydrodipicolinate synthase/N-acetylneuraminate lyase
MNEASFPGVAFGVPAVGVVGVVGAVGAVGAFGAVGAVAPAESCATAKLAAARRMVAAIDISMNIGPIEGET